MVSSKVKSKLLPVLFEFKHKKKIFFCYINVVPFVSSGSNNLCAVLCLKFQRDWMKPLPQKYISSLGESANLLQPSGVLRCVWAPARHCRTAPAVPGKNNGVRTSGQPAFRLHWCSTLEKDAFKCKALL